jgi:hypothetical protein
VDTKEKSVLDGLRTAIIAVLEIIAGWLGASGLDGEEMAKLIKDIEALIDKKIIPEFKKVTDKLAAHDGEFKKVNDKLDGLQNSIDALGKTPPKAPTK